MRGWKLREVLLGGGIIAAFGSLLVVHGGIRLGTPIFGGDTGVFDAILGLLTLIALIAGGIGAFLSYGAAIESIETARVKDEWEQFRSGVQMLGANTDAEVIAGIDILQHIGTTSPPKFELLVFNVLRSFANELSAGEKKRVWNSTGDRRWNDEDVPESHAFIALGLLATRMNHRPEMTVELIDGRMPVANILLVRRVITGHPFCKLFVNRLALDQVTFRECDFRGSKLVVFARSVTFEQCDLTNTELQVQLAANGSQPVFKNCDTAGARVFVRGPAELVAKGGD